MKSNISNTYLLKWFVKEEFRVFQTLFGTKRLLLFPIVLFTLSLVMGGALPVFDISLRLLSGVLLIMISLFGLQTGSIGFEARDTLDNLMGDSSRMLFSSRTLPISKKRLAGLFLIKDAIVYSGFMLLPIFIGALLGLILSPIATSVLVPSFVSIGAMYAMIITSFMLGVSIGFILTSIDYTEIQGILGVFSASAVIIPTGYYIYQNSSLISNIGSLEIVLGQTFLTFVFVGIGLWQFDITSRSKSDSQYSNLFRKVTSVIGTTQVRNLVVKTFIDMVRSPGGLWKVVFSTGVISLSVVFLVEVVKKFMITGVQSQYLYGSLFSLSVFAVYTVVYRYDSESYYSVYPVTTSQVRKSKSIVYMLTSLVLVGIYYTIAVATTVSVIQYLMGLFVMASLIVYQLGIFLIVAKDEPLKFLFNGMMFSGYSISLLIVMIPLTMIGLFGSVIPSVVTYIAVTVSTLCLVVGLGIAKLSVDEKF